VCKLFYNINKSQFVVLYLKLSSILGAWQTASLALCIPFLYFCPYGFFTRESFNIQFLTHSHYFIQELELQYNKRDARVNSYIHRNSMVCKKWRNLDENRKCQSSFSPYRIEIMQQSVWENK
jgi:hypothetical protein